MQGTLFNHILTRLCGRSDTKKILSYRFHNVTDQAPALVCGDDLDNTQVPGGGSLIWGIGVVGSSMLELKEPRNNIAFVVRSCAITI